MTRVPFALLVLGALGWAAAAGVAAGAAPAAEVAFGAAVPVARGIDVIPGAYVEGRQPDGNTVIFAAPDGLIVMDTGRHAEHTQRILDYATRTKRPIKAIINSHWHLDHIGGNTRIRAVYPDARIYASGALVGAMQGFLADYRRDLEGALHQMPNDPQAPGWRDELVIIDAAPRSFADEQIEESGRRTIAGRKLIVNLAAPAVTAGDVWVFDPATHVVAAGDLVTLPVPFLDTACPQGWKDALDKISGVQFTTLIPGHGAPMPHEGFESYRSAYGNLLACAGVQDKADGDCVEGWIADAGTLITDGEQQRARKMMSYYVSNILRGKAERIRKMCGVA